MFPIPDHLNPSLYNWDQLTSGTSRRVGVRDIPELRELIETIVLLPDRGRRFASAIAGNEELTEVGFPTGYATQHVLDCVSTLPNLERLYFGHLRAADISGLARLEKLEFLSIDSMSSASSFEPITHLQNLIAVSIGFSQKISSLDAFSDNSLSSLRALHLGESSGRVVTVESLSPLGEIPSLEYVAIGRVRTKDRSLTGFLKLPKLKALEIDKNARYSKDDIDALRFRGIDVSLF